MKQFLAAVLVCLPAVLRAEEPTRRLNDAATVLSEVMSAPDKGIPTNLLARAHCIIIVPGVKQAAFIAGAKYGKGFFSCRRGADWTAPASVRIEGGSVGFQIGLLETDLILLVMNTKGESRLLSTRFTLGGAAEVAGGPVGRSTTAQTDASLRAEMLSYSRARGAFAGVSLSGATLRQDVDDNAEIFGRPLTNKEIMRQNIPWPGSASELHSVLNRYAARARRLKHRS
ncbi:MAG TPA: lipid-binding SYLF domain-containing protein [Bryobacteraceae bacterium]|nr:lipid-binding SYLF domain-containing protein [Bryobacteraceae bacterium]